MYPCKGSELCSSFWRREQVLLQGRGILRIRHMLQPRDVNPMLVGLLHRQMHHRVPGIGAVPMNVARFDQDRISGTNLLHRLALQLDTAQTCEDMERLTHRMRVPSRTRARLE